MPIYGSCYMELFNEPTPDRHVGRRGGRTHTTTEHIAESRPLAVAKLYQEAYEVCRPGIRIISASLELSPSDPAQRTVCTRLHQPKACAQAEQQAPERARERWERQRVP